MESSKNKYVNEVIKQGRLPLPILNKIENKFLFMQDYNIEPKNFEMMIKALPSFIPNSLNKIAFSNNQLTDQAIAKFFNMMKVLPNGPKLVAIIQNTAGI